MLQEAAEMLAQWDSNEPLVTLEPDADGSYQITPDVSANLVSQPKKGLTRSPTTGRLSLSMLGRYCAHKQPS
jgi:hypothetical protein